MKYTLIIFFAGLLTISNVLSVPIASNDLVNDNLEEKGIFDYFSSTSKKEETKTKDKVVTKKKEEVVKAEVPKDFLDKVIDSHGKLFYDSTDAVADAAKKTGGAVIDTGRDVSKAGVDLAGNKLKEIKNKGFLETVKGTGKDMFHMLG